MIDVTILQVLRNRTDYQKLRDAVPDVALEPATRVILDDFGEYFGKSECSNIRFEEFWSWFSKIKHPSMKDEQKNTYVAILRNACKDPDPNIKATLLNDLHELRLANSLGNLVEQWKEGEVADLSAAVSLAHDRYKADTGMKTVDWIQTPIEDLLSEEADESGIRWRLQTLNLCMRGLRPGDMGIVAARPDKGKTSFFASEITFMAKQLPPDRNVLWLNNEGPGKRIIPRLYQAALGCPLSDLFAMQKAGALRKEYAAAVGRIDRIKVFDVHGYNVSKIESIVENYNPGIVVADMIDHFKGFQFEARTDLVLEEMYKWFREMAVKYSFIGLASSQISNEGDGLQFPTLGMLKDSKTGKQGACDFQLMIGASNDPGLVASRFLSLPKNKLRREGASGDPHQEVFFKPEICRYEDIQVGE